MNNLDIAILGVKLASEILEIPKPKVYFIEDDCVNNKMIAGIFRANEYQILFNENWVNNSEQIEIIISASHETRHAYQSYSIKENINESNETLNLWNYEFNNYIIAIGTNKPNTDINYLKQSIEIDAIRFTYYKVKELFEIETFIPDEIKSIIFNKEINY